MITPWLALILAPVCSLIGVVVGNWLGQRRIQTQAFHEKRVESISEFVSSASSDLGYVVGLGNEEEARKGLQTLKQLHDLAEKAAFFVSPRVGELIRHYMNEYTKVLMIHADSKLTGGGYHFKELRELLDELNSKLKKEIFKVRFLSSPR
jgi:hypothetical protein